jgi:hypothetical protein
MCTPYIKLLNKMQYDMLLIKYTGLPRYFYVEKMNIK